MASILIDQLRPASFRGVPFNVDSSGFDGGRRTQVHEYPQRDKPYAQDLGRSSRRVEFDAFVVGETYGDQANALLGALEEGGTGILVHPWLGSLTVNVLTYRVQYDRGLGHTRFGLSFVEAGELTFPTAAESTALLSRKAANDLETASVNQFAEIFATLGYISHVAEQALIIYGNALKFLSNPVFGLSSLLGYSALFSNLTSLSALFVTPINLGWNFAGLLNLSGKAKSGAIPQNDLALVPAVRGLTRMATDAALAPIATIGKTPTQQQVIDNQNAINAHARQLLLVQAVGLSSYCQCVIYDDILALKNELASALEAESLRVSNDDLYQALTLARSSMWKDLTDRSRDSARLITLTPPEVLPALVIAYDFYEDASRDLEIVSRNKIKHPSFVPAESLRVLSR